VTYQTDEKGQPVNKILVESCTDIDKSSIWVQWSTVRAARRLHGFTEGGVEIEKVAHAARRRSSRRPSIR
jgi:succinyl-CoA synthetase beta subunit